MYRTFECTRSFGDVKNITFADGGILMEFCEAIPHEYSTEKLKNYIKVMNRIVRKTDPHRVWGSSFVKFELFDEVIKFKRTPYKQVYPCTYKQRFVFLKITLFTPYGCVKSLGDTYAINKEKVKSFIKNNVSTLTLHV